MLFGLPEYLILVLPLGGSLLVPLVGRFSEKLRDWTPAIFMGISMLLCWSLLLDIGHTNPSWDWINIPGILVVPFSVLLDPLSVIMAVLASTLCFLIYVYSTEHDYGTVTLGDSPTWNVTVENTGTADLDITGVSFTGSADLSCGATFPITLAPTDQTTLPITWSPSAFGELNAIATVESTDPVNPGVDITLTGDAVYSGPEINIPSNSHDYAAVRNNAYTRWFMTIENLGDASHFKIPINSIDLL